MNDGGEAVVGFASWYETRYVVCAAEDLRSGTLVGKAMIRDRRVSNGQCFDVKVNTVRVSSKTKRGGKGEGEELRKKLLGWG